MPAHTLLPPERERHPPRRRLLAFLRTTSSAPATSGTTEEPKASVRSLPCGSAETTSAGRTFVDVRSVKGKGTRTRSPRRSIAVPHRLPVLAGVDVLGRVGEKFERAAGRRKLRYGPPQAGKPQSLPAGRRGHIVVENDDRDLSLLRQIEALQGSGAPRGRRPLLSSWARPSPSVYQHREEYIGGGFTSNRNNSLRSCR